MKFLPQKLAGVFLIEPEPFVDRRGLLRRHFCERELSAQGIQLEVKQCNVSENPARHTLRGFHFQRPPFGEAKLLSCMKGAVYDIVIDLRPDSRTYLQWMPVELSDENRLSLYVPPHCGNGYMTMRDDTWIFYYHSEFYTPKAEGGIRYDDPLFGFTWPAQPAVISDKDRNYPNFEPGRPSS